MDLNVRPKKELNMNATWKIITFTLGFTMLANLSFGEDFLGEYILVTAERSDVELNPHTLDAVSARVTKTGDKYEITIDDILGNEPCTVPLYIEGEKLSFFLPPRKFSRDGKDLMSNAKAYFGEIVLDLYIAGTVTSGRTLHAFKLKRVRPISSATSG